MPSTKDVRQAVEAELASDQLIEADGITVRNFSGDVVLNGTVPSYRPNLEAVEAAWRSLGMAGGDGSLAVVAAVAAAHGLPFVCVPAGTRNHFALDLGVDRRDLIGALEAFTNGVERRIDVADVNERMFLNNVSMGIYGEAVRKAAYRDAKVRTLVETAEQVLGPSAQAPELRLTDDTGREHRHLSVVLVSNNPYALERPLARGTRPALDTGQLGILILDLLDDKPTPPGRAWRAPRLEVDAPVPVHAGIDGEPADLSPPLLFTIRPAALRVRISSRHPGVSPSGLFSPASQPVRAAARHKGSQAGRAELKTSRNSPEAPITPLIASAAAASPALAVPRLLASAFRSCHTVSLIKLPEAQSAYSSAAQKPVTSASRVTAMSPYLATAFLDRPS